MWRAVRYAGAPMFMMPSTSDDATMVAERAIHGGGCVEIHAASFGRTPRAERRPHGGLAHGGRGGVQRVLARPGA